MIRIIQFGPWKCTPVARYYGNERKALSFVDPDTYEPILTASVNVVNAKCDDDEIFIKDYSENQGIKDILVEGGYIEPNAIKTVQEGFVSISSYRLTQEALQLWQ